MLYDLTRMNSALVGTIGIAAIPTLSVVFAHNLQSPSEMILKSPKVPSQRLN